MAFPRAVTLSASTSVLTAAPSTISTHSGILPSAFLALTPNIQLSRYGMLKERRSISMGAKSSLARNVLGRIGATSKRTGIYRCRISWSFNIEFPERSYYSRGQVAMLETYLSATRNYLTETMELGLFCPKI
jgi:hypothetical protein